MDNFNSFNSGLQKWAHLALATQYELAPAHHWQGGTKGTTGTGSKDKALGCGYATTTLHTVLYKTCHVTFLDTYKDPKTEEGVPEWSVWSKDTHALRPWLQWIDPIGKLPKHWESSVPHESPHSLIFSWGLTRSEQTTNASDCESHFIA